MPRLWSYKPFRGLVLPPLQLSTITLTENKMPSEDEILARLKPGCICKGIKLHTILTAIESGAGSFEEIAKLTNIGGGSCKSKRCRAKVLNLLTHMDRNATTTTAKTSLKK